MTQPRLSIRAGLAGSQPISRLMHSALAHPDLISLAAGFVDPASLPVAAAQTAIDRLLSDPAKARAALQYGTTAGYPPLREAVLARQLAADRTTAAASGASVENVVVTAGSNQLLHLVGETLLDPGDIVLCAAPSYFVFIGMLGGLGAQAVGVAADEQGLIPEALEEELQACQRAGQLARVKAIYVVSYFDNPSSASLAAERRPQIVEIVQRWSRHHKLYVIEDAAYRHLRYAGDDLPSLRSLDAGGQTVILVDTFSKSFSPGIRVGWGVLPSELVGPVCEVKGNIDFGSPNFAQYAMAEVLAAGLFEPHVSALRTRYQAKLAAMLAAADEHLAPLAGVRWRRPDGGLYVWVELPHGLDAGPAGPLMEAALAEGVLYVPGEYCYPPAGVPARKNTIRLSFGVQEPDKIHEGVAALARAIRAVGDNVPTGPCPTGQSASC